MTSIQSQTFAKFYSDLQKFIYNNYNNEMDAESAIRNIAHSLTSYTDVGKGYNPAFINKEENSCEETITMVKCGVNLNQHMKKCDSASYSNWSCLHRS